MAGDTSSETSKPTIAPSPGPPEPVEGSSNLRARVPAEIRNVSFPVSVRGYDRKAVDAYVHRVNRVIAELEVSRSPQAAVRHAVDRVSEQTKGILQQARESAEKITAAAREEAEQILAVAKAEAAELVVNASTEADRLGAEGQQALADARAEASDIVARSNAEAAERLQRTEEEIAASQEEAAERMRELQADTEAVWKERHQLLDEIGGMAVRLQKAAGEAAARFAPEESNEPSEEATEWPEAEVEAEPTLVKAPNEPTDQGSRTSSERSTGGRSSRRRKS